MRSDVANIPPLNPAIAGVIPRAVISVRNPRGGLLLMIKIFMPLVPLLPTSARFPGVENFQRVTRA